MRRLALHPGSGCLAAITHHFKHLSNQILCMFMQQSSLQAGFAVVAEVVILFIYLLFFSFLAMINVSLVEVIVNLVHD